MCGLIIDSQLKHSWIAARLRPSWIQLLTLRYVWIMARSFSGMQAAGGMQEQVHAVRLPDFNLLS